MLVLLPPSEGKASGGSGAPLDLARLSHPALNPVRERLVDALEAAATTDPAGLQAALGCPAGEVDKDAALRTSPTLPALSRYTGVVYEALSYPTLSPAGRRRANASLRVASALFGLLAPRDAVPAYRLSGGTRLPGVGSLATMWRPALEPELAPHRLVVDLRSGPYAALARAPHAVTVRVLRESGGTRSVVSHDNKYTKGLLARVLCEQGARSVADVAEAGRAVADLVEVDGQSVDLVLFGLATARARAGSRLSAPAPWSRRSAPCALVSPDRPHLGRSSAGASAAVTRRHVAAPDAPPEDHHAVRRRAACSTTRLRNAAGAARTSHHVYRSIRQPTASKRASRRRSLATIASPAWARLPSASTPSRERSSPKSSRPSRRARRSNTSS